MRSTFGPAGKVAHYFIDSKLTPLIVMASILLEDFPITFEDAGEADTYDPSACQQPPN